LSFHRPEAVRVIYGESASDCMAKYSTGTGGSNSGDSCELCGAAGVDTQTVNVAGAKLAVCSDCAQHDDTAGSDQSRDDDNRKKRAAQNTARMHDATAADAKHWEDGADYEDDQLPYLKRDYDELLTDARQQAGYQLEELAEELGIDDGDLLALEQGRAAQAGVGGSVVGALERFLDIELVDE
jgi:ribosome-binding protein aMBF1 (putative translation factor)